MKNDVSLIFSQHLDFLPSSAVYLLAKQFVKRYSYVYSSAMREDAPDGILGEIEAFLFEEIRTLIRRDPRLDLRQQGLTPPRFAPAARPRPHYFVRINDIGSFVASPSLGCARAARWSHQNGLTTGSQV